MPTYEYACTRCGQHVEVFQRLTEAPLETCGVCGGPLRKVFHPVGIVFKGSGFYATDSRSKPATSSADGASGAGREGGTDGGKDGAKKDGGKGGAKKDGAVPSERSRPSSGSGASSGSSSGGGGERAP